MKPTGTCVRRAAAGLRDDLDAPLLIDTGQGTALDFHQQHRPVGHRDRAFRKPQALCKVAPFQFERRRHSQPLRADVPMGRSPSA